jgi:hypothetical protein
MDLVLNSISRIKQAKENWDEFLSTIYDGNDLSRSEIESIAHEILLKDIDIVALETGLLNLSFDNFSISIHNDEKLSTNPYSNIFGNESMVMSEIKQKKET